MADESLHIVSMPDGSFRLAGVMPPGDYCAIPKEQWERELAEIRAIHNELFAFAVFMMDWGKVESGTPQSQRFLKTLGRLQDITKHQPAFPDDYPRGFDRLR